MNKKTINLEFNPQEIVTISRILRNVFNSTELSWAISNLSDMERIDVARTALRLTDIADSYDEEN